MSNYALEMELYFELKDTPEASRESYRRRAMAFLDYVQSKGKEPAEIVTRDIQEYILHLKRKGLAAGTINNYASSIRFLCKHVLSIEWDTKKLPRMRRVHKMPVIPSKQIITGMLDAITNLKHKAMLSLVYGSGLRVSEVARLRIADICSQTMQVRVENAKHNTNRYTILSERALIVLRQYFKVYFADRTYTAKDWLFCGRDPAEHVHVKTIKNTVIKLRNRLGLDERITAHTLRHCFATHSLEAGVDPVLIQQLLGHKRFATTATYLHLTSKSLMGIQSPLDQ